MKTSQILLATVMTATALLQAACTAKIEGVASESPFEGGQQVFDLAAVNGTWSSGCVVEFNQGTESKFTLVNGAFTSVVKIYRYQQCVPSELMQTQTEKGQFVVIGQSVHEQGSYEIEVQTDESGFTYIESDLIKIDGNKMYFGDHSAPYANNFPTKTDSTRPFTKEVR